MAGADRRRCLYQEQPLVVPYVFHGKDRQYYPDVAVLDRNGRGYIIEVKPIYGMYREQALAKALACLDHVGRHGMGYLLVDQHGRSIAEYASVPYNRKIAEEIEALIDKLGRIGFAQMRAIFETRRSKFSEREFISMTLNRGWAVTSAPGFTVGRLTEGISFEPLLSHLPRW